LNSAAKIRFSFVIAKELIRKVIDDCKKKKGAMPYLVEGIAPL